ncbi:MAG TPA: sulfate ABC transporter ATP-binding protein [Terriglobia bacterium]|nr:sulfate ABC transporter ATP-binding protein [Terriglobia bacterium]
MGIQVQNVSKRFGSFDALKNIDLSVPDGELLALLGPSGSGKTTLLRMIAGLDFPDTGSVHLDGEDASSTDASERRVGFVFQHYALFRHMTVFENVAFGLRVRPRKLRPSRQEISERVSSLLKLVQLDWIADRYPGQLSGGQRQRIALARALAVEPKFLLLDEPFGALDARVRKELRLWLRRLHDEINIACVFVTHDQEEALEVADRVAIMDKGKIEQVGTPEEVWENPANPFVYSFLGNVNLFHGRVQSGKARIGGIEIDAPDHADASDSPAIVYARPHEMEISRESFETDAIRVEVARVQSVGSNVKLRLKHADSAEFFEAEVTRERQRDLDLKAGDVIFVKPRQARVFIADPAQAPINYQI